MTQNDTSRPWGKVLKARRLVLLGSVAGLGIAVLAGGTVVQSQAPFLGEPARRDRTAPQLRGSRGQGETGRRVGSR